MIKKIKSYIPLMFTGTLPSLCSCASSKSSGDCKQDNEALTFDNASWSYDSDNDVYYQIGITYCAKPQAKNYESLAICVPGAYMDATDNGDGTYTCSINSTNEINGYTVDTAPIVIPIITPGYAAQEAATSYSYECLSDYLDSGFIYVYAGCRGRNNGTNDDGTSFAGGSPWGVTDLKAAVRYLRFNKETLPGDTDRIFTFGHSGGGAQSSLMGATGDSELYYSYLESIGAAMCDSDGNAISDAICGAMCWCPITALDVADEAYEWMMGQYSDEGNRRGDTWTSALSDDLAEKFAAYINSVGLKDENGNTLTLTESDTGIYTSGSYYDYMLGVIEESLNNFLSDTTFPNPYETIQDYINSLNSDVQWVTYDASTSTAKISSIEAFVQHCKNASKDVGAFDDLNLSQVENYVFGNEKTDALHFDSIMAGLLSDNADEYAEYTDYDSTYKDDYTGDLDNIDAFGTKTQTRQDMYNPMYYLSCYYKGYGTSTVASFWRINTGINQGDTSLSTEMNLALALKQNSGVKSVEFTTVWGQGHTTAERTGDSAANLISWVNDCCSQSK